VCKSVEFPAIVIGLFVSKSSLGVMIVVIGPELSIVIVIVSSASFPARSSA